MSESKANVIPSMKAVINAVYPVGSYYWSDKDTSPEALFGVGTWEQITDRFVYAARTKIAGSTGGEETHTITCRHILLHIAGTEQRK